MILWLIFNNFAFPTNYNFRNYVLRRCLVQDKLANDKFYRETMEQMGSRFHGIQSMKNGKHMPILEILWSEWVGGHWHFFGILVEFLRISFTTYLVEIVPIFIVFFWKLIRFYPSLMCLSIYSSNNDKTYQTATYLICDIGSDASWMKLFE